jgi:hypothetical protein
VLGSANQLFLKIRGSLNRCVKLVSRGNTLLRLSSAFKVAPHCHTSTRQCMRHGPAKWLFHTMQGQSRASACID